MYTCLFIFTASGIFLWHFLSGKSLVWNIDGVDQSFRAFMYYSRYLKNIARGVLSGEGFFAPHWEFALGEGADIISSLHYYGVGDPLNLLSVLVPVRFLINLFDALLILRLYISGAAFIWLCMETLDKKDNIAVVSGAIIYSLSSWVIYFVAMHNLFISALMYLPFIILGEYKIITGKRPYLFIISAALALVTNIYFFIIVAAVTAIYAVEKLVVLYGKDISRIVINIFKIGGYAMISICLTAIISFPMIYFCLINPRMGNGIAQNMFYSLKYYLTLNADLFSLPEENSGLTPLMGFYAADFIAVILLFTVKGKNILLKIFGVSMGIAMLLPILGKALNGMAYPSNRWNVAVVLFSAYVLVVMWDEILSLSRDPAVRLFATVGIILILCLFSGTANTGYNLYNLAMVFALICAVLIFRSHKKHILIFSVIISAWFTSFLYYSPYGENFINSQMSKAGAVEQMTGDISAPVLSAADKDGMNEFFRFSGTDYNRGLLAGLSSTDYYWSLANPYSFEFRNDIEHNEGISYKYYGYDNRSIINALDNVKYYVVESGSEKPLPYGYSYLSTQDSKDGKSYDVYRNDFFLPLGYTYDSYISKQEWLGFNAAERENAMLDSAVIEEPDEALGVPEKTDYHNRVREISFDMETAGSGIVTDGNKIYSTEEYQALKLTPDEPLVDGEVLCEVKGVDYTGSNKFLLYFGKDEAYDPGYRFNKRDFLTLPYAEKRNVLREALYYEKPVKAYIVVVKEDDQTNEIKYITEKNQMFSGRRDFIANMGYADRPEEALWLTFKQIGVYDYDEINVYLNPLDDYAERIAALKENTLENVKLGNDAVTGTISLDKDKLLCMSIPYSAGWRAYIDGIGTKIYRTNDMFMSIDVPEGTHDIEFNYSTPFYNIGCVVTIVSMIGLIIMILARERKCFQKI